MGEHLINPTNQQSNVNTDLSVVMEGSSEAIHESAHKGEEEEVKDLKKVEALPKVSALKYISSKQSLEKTATIALKENENPASAKKTEVSNKKTESSPKIHKAGT